MQSTHLFNYPYTETIYFPEKCLITIDTKRRILPEMARTGREVAMGLTPGKGGKPEPVHYEIVFTQDFEGL